MQAMYIEYAPVEKLQTEVSKLRGALQDLQVAAGTQQVEMDALRKRIIELTTCDCGLPLSTGWCRICDNDE